MDLKDFAMRNKVPIGQMLVFAILVVSGLLLFQMGSSKGPEYPKMEDIAKTMNSTPHEPLIKEMNLSQNCTPLFNSTIKMSYEYDVQSVSLEGPVRSHVSFDYAGEEELLGEKVDIVEIRANSSLQNMTLTLLSKLWLDPKTGECLAATVDMGQGQAYKVDCSDANFGVPSIACSEQLAGLNATANETVEVPAGKFLATRYEKGSETIWVATGIPVPVRFASVTGGARAMAELVRYEVKG